MREVAAELERRVLMFSGGKDSLVLLRLAEKAFRRGALPFPILHVDTGHNFPEVIEFRDRLIEALDERLIVASVQEAIDAGVVAVVSLVSPMEADRRLACELHDAAGLEFHEVFVSTPVEECERRDPKGLYARARAGKLPGFTGVDAPYQAPENPDFEFDTASGDGDDAVGRLLEALASQPS
jgi:hypothetical protein